MKVYHISETLKVNEELKLDYKNQQGLAEPFVKAMKHSFEMFYGMLLQAEYLGETLAKFDLSGMPTNETKWATEGIFEYIRRNEFPDAPCRLRANYFFKDVEQCKMLFTEHWGMDEKNPEAELFHLYEMELEGNYLECDMNLFDEAFDLVWRLDSPMQMMEAMNLARKYFRGDKGENAVMEIISEEKAVAKKDLTEFLR